MLRRTRKRQAGDGDRPCPHCGAGVKSYQHECENCWLAHHPAQCRPGKETAGWFALAAAWAKEGTWHGAA